MSIDDISEQFKREGYPVIHKTLRAQLSRLVTAGKILRIGRGIYSSNNFEVVVEPPGDEAHRYEAGIYKLAREITQYSENLPTGSPVLEDEKYFSLDLAGGNEDILIAEKLIRNGRIDASRSKVEKLHERSEQRLRNYRIWDDLIDTLPRLSAWLSLDADAMAQKVGVAWELSVTVGRFIDLDKRILLDARSTYLPLEPDVRLALEDVNTSIGTLIREFPTAMRMDDKHREWNDAPNAAEYARSVFREVENTNILVRDFVPRLRQALEADLLGDIRSRKSSNWGIGTVRRLGYASIVVAGGFAGAVVGGATSEVGAEIARQTPCLSKVRSQVGS